MAMTMDQMRVELDQLRGENEKLKKRTETSLSLKVSEKGGVSVYGLGRFPVTLYHEQWAKLAAAMPQITDFIDDNLDKLKSKE
jgi:hypothetical protein